MFLVATPLAFVVVFNRKRYKLPWYLVALALVTLLSGTIVAIGLVGVIASSTGL